MRIGIDYTAAVRQRAGIGRYTRGLVGALLTLPSPHHYTLFAATGGLRSAISNLQGLQSATCDLRTVPLSDEWLARLWHRLRLPIPIEAIVGRVDLFYSPDFILPPILPDVRTLLTVHDLSFLHYPDHFVPKLVRYLSRAVPRSIARARRVLADSEATRTDLIQFLGVPPESVEVLYSGVDPRFRPEPEPGERERLQSRYGVGERSYVLSVGTLQPRKNYVRLIRAFARLRLAPLCPETLVIAGGRGWLYQEIYAEAEKHPDRVRILGFVDEADLPALYREAALFVFPSFYEGFGLPVLEAMACGVPVVCSNASSLPEVAGAAALLVDPHDEEGLTEAMERALADEGLREEMVARGLEQAARFTWERAARQLLATLDAVAVGGHPVSNDVSELRSDGEG
ncbi:MAG TPA: glycosyltransferase family 1 protein [Anaerolineales bacterium]|nr:glycosyltransferase family 1 protein [Anaerolineae bacterium]HIQ01124.1 glycosyltransferase family 1 protein [Anaerolineales bacterium]